jgi:hypothetical protein
MTHDPADPRLVRERRTIAAMISIACRAWHGTGTELCTDCAELKVYAFYRLSRCPFGGGKPTCVNCPVHCYTPEMREKARQVMRFAGPRMLTRHPILAIRHLIDGKRKPPELPRRRKVTASA